MCTTNLLQDQWTSTLVWKTTFPKKTSAQFLYKNFIPDFSVV